MEKALALVLVGLILSALLMTASIVVACYATAKIGHRVLKDVITGFTTLVQPIWVWSETLRHWVFGGLKIIEVPWEYEVYETILSPRIAGGEIFWVLAAVFFGFTFLFTLLLADELGVLGVQRILTICAILIAVGAIDLLLAGYITGILLFYAVAAGFLPALGLLLFMAILSYVRPR